MSKYVKELMMDQLKTELDGDRSVLILDLKGLDAITEYQFRRDLRKKSIKMRVLRNTLARRVFDDMGMGGLSRFLEGPSVAVWGGGGVTELAKEISAQVKKLKKPEIKGGAVDGTVIGPEQVEDITKLPSREALIGQVLGLLLSPPQQVLSMLNGAPSTLIGQLEEFVKKQQEGSAESSPPPAECEAPATPEASPPPPEGEAPATPEA